MSQTYNILTYKVPKDENINKRENFLKYFSLRNQQQLQQLNLLLHH
jgi:hypothetical protein